MKIADKQVEVHSRGVGEKVQYKVAQNAKIMKMLADSLYKNKVKAPVRELSTNALDGHVKAGCPDKPFDVYLPTRLHLEYRIRDYGCAMDREQLTEMYTTYGESDKSDSNDYNGCMGIGSKSPFAYANSFTTTSIHKGKKYVCVNAKDTTGIPTLNFLADGEDTDEPDGIEIAFAVKQEDCEKFSQEAAAVYRYFDVKPNIKRGECTIPGREYMFESDDKSWRIYKNSEDSVAIMGYVAYPIERSYFSDQGSDEEGHRSWYRYDDTPEAILLGMGIEMDFAIGEVEMDISREGLQYNDVSVGTIKARLAKILDWLKAEMSKSYDDCECLWDARLRHQDLSTGKMHRLEKLTKVQKPSFGGVDLTTQIEVENTSPEWAGITLIRFRDNDAPDANNRRYGRKRARISRDDYVHNISVPTTINLPKLRFYENDMDRGSYAAIQRQLEDTNIGVVEAYLVKFDDDAARDTFIKTMGFKDASYLHKTSDVPRLERKKAGKRENVFDFKIVHASVDSYNYSSPRFAKDWWDGTEVDFTDGGLFVEINSFKCRSADLGDINSSQLGRMLKLLESLGVTLPSIYGIKTAVCKKYEKSDDWENVFAWIKRQLESYLDSSPMANHLANIQEINGFSDSDKYKPVTKHLLHDSPLYNFQEKLDELGKVRTKHAAVCEKAHDLAEIIKFKLEGKAKYDLSAESEKIQKRYEMLTVLDNWDIERGSNAEKCARYVSFVDSCEGDN